MFKDEWRYAAEDPTARKLKAKRARPKRKPAPPAEEGPTTGDLF